jgi:hypothetical protein
MRQRFLIHIGGAEVRITDRADGVVPPLLASVRPVADAGRARSCLPPSMGLKVRLKKLKRAAPSRKMLQIRQFGVATN